MSLIACLVVGLSFVSSLAQGRTSDTAGGLQVYRALTDVALDPGRPLVLVFFSAACPVCFDDLFEVRYFVEKNGLEAEVVGVSRDPESVLLTFLEKYAYRRPVVRDAGKKLFRAHKVDLEPYVVILDNGRVVFKDNGLLDFKSRREEREKWLMRNAGRSTAASS